MINYIVMTHRIGRGEEQRIYVNILDQFITTAILSIFYTGVFLVQGAVIVYQEGELEESGSQFLVHQILGADFSV